MLLEIVDITINYGMSVESIGQDLFSTRTDMTDEEKTKEAQKIYDSLMNGFPHLRDAINGAQEMARQVGYTETILGRRRHHPDMQLPRFEFKPMPGYVNPDVDPLDPETMKNKDQIPERIVKSLTREFNNYKYYGQIVKRTKQLAEEKIKVTNNSSKIAEASRQVWNAVIQGSAADLTKMAMIRLINDDEWKEVGGRFICPVHDELIVEVPFENREKGAEVLSRCMCEAGSFLPFSLSCDVETTFRWYGLGVDDILSYDKPESLDWDALSESNIKWLQCMVIENEYELPVYEDENGKKPIGIAAHGDNGKISDDLKNAVHDYMAKYGLTPETFLDHIEKKVIQGVY